MKKYFKIALLILFPAFATAQQSLPDSTKLKIKNAPNDSTLFRGYTGAALFFTTINSDSALKYIDIALSITEKNKKWLQHSSSLGYKAEFLMNLGRFAGAFQCLNQSFQIAEDPKMETMDWILVRTITPEVARLWRLSETHYRYASLMRLTKNLEQAIFHNKEAIRIGNNAGGLWGPVRVAYANMNLGIIYLQVKKTDSALLFFNEAKRLGSEQIKYTSHHGNIIAYQGQVYALTGNHVKAKQLLHTALQIAQTRYYPYNIAKACNELFNIYQAENNKDSTIFYALKMKEQVNELGTFVTDELNKGLVYKKLFLGYRMNNENDSATKYSALAIEINDSISNVQLQNLAEFQNVLLEEKQRLQNIEKEKLTYQNKIRTYSMLAGIVVFMLISFLLYRNNSNRKKANALLQNQKEEIEHQKKSVEETLAELKSTQSQLIQSEKMASLGELTAGIAHEIQNPLNFVNNFSEVSRELIDELKPFDKLRLTAEQEELLNNIDSNLEKINHHGKRAGDIVKGMLQHSRSSNGTKEPTDINALCDEYLRLGYHGLRAKDKSFNATMKTDFDTSIGKINIIPQDIGRVVLNLLINAFYVVDEKKTLRQAQGDTHYEPTVSIQTKKINNKVEIRVTDNGNGIPQKVLDKIFQPFFTTKPTGQGTGLGLSLSYDIIKAQGGELKVETEEGVGSTFTILLPTNI